MNFGFFRRFRVVFRRFRVVFRRRWNSKKSRILHFKVLQPAMGQTKQFLFVCFCKNPKALASFEVPFSPHSVCTTQITNGCSRCSQNELARTIPGSLLTRKVIETATLGTYLGVSSV